jgi:hypothetical protein
MRQTAVGLAPDSFDMSTLKAALGGRGGGCQPPTHKSKEHAAREQSECAERDVGDDAVGAEACVSSPVGSGDGGKDGPGGGGDDKTGAAARAAATWRVEVPSDEKENLDPVDTAHALACCLAALRRLVGRPGPPGGAPPRPLACTAGMDSKLVPPSRF